MPLLLERQEILPWKRIHTDKLPSRNLGLLNVTVVLKPLFLMSSASREGHISSCREVAQMQELLCPGFTYPCHSAARPTAPVHFPTISAKELLDSQAKGL